MSWQMTTVDGDAVSAEFIGFDPSSTNGVRIGEYEFSLEEFCVMATHFLGGGSFGWGNDKTPQVVNNALSTLFELYEQVDGKWRRKTEYGLPLPAER